MIALLVGVMWYLIVVLIAFPEWLMMSILSFAYWLFVSLLCWKVCSGALLLSIDWLVCLLLLTCRSYLYILELCSFPLLLELFAAFWPHPGSECGDLVAVIRDAESKLLFVSVNGYESVFSQGILGCQGYLFQILFNKARFITWANILLQVWA